MTEVLERQHRPPGRGAWGRFVVGPRQWWQEAVVVFVAYQAYDWLRGHLHPAAGPAFRHAVQLVDAEKALGIFWEASVQRWLLGWHPGIELLDIYYGTIHFVVPAVALAILWRRAGDRYRRFRNAFGFMLVLSLGGFFFWPLAPPRVLPPSYHFVDTGATIGGLGPLDRGSMKDDNPFAAMPSLHVGWSTWCVVALFPVLKRWWSRALIVLYPVVTLLAIVVTANHYLLDAVGGWVVLAAGIAAEDLRARLRAGRAAVGGDERSGGRLRLEAEDLGVASVDGGLDP